MIYQRQALEIVDRFPKSSFFAVIVEHHKMIEVDYRFYSKVLVDKDRNSLVNYMVNFAVETYKRMLRTMGALINDQLEFDIQLHAFACVHMTQLWVLKKKRESPEEIVYKLIKAMPQHLYEALTYLKR